MKTDQLYNLIGAIVGKTGDEMKEHTQQAMIKDLDQHRKFFDEMVEATREYLKKNPEHGGELEAFAAARTIALLTRMGENTLAEMYLAVVVREANRLNNQTANQVPVS